MNDFEGLRPNFSNLILTNEHTQMYEGKLIIGQAGISTKSQETQTGFYRKKYLIIKHLLLAGGQVNIIILSLDWPRLC